VSANDGYHQNFLRILKAVFEALGRSSEPVTTACGHSCRVEDLLNLTRSGKTVVSLLTSWVLTSLQVTCEGDQRWVLFVNCLSCSSNKVSKIVVTPFAFSSVFPPWKRLENNLKKIAAACVDKCPDLKKVEVRKKITPVTQVTPRAFKFERDSVDPLQAKLELDFFRNHPPCVQKVVSFGGEIVAVLAIRKLREKFLPEAKEQQLLKSGGAEHNACR
jgi:hypothetical protein